jgi:hypothetical protein
MRWPGSIVAAALVVGIAGPSSAGQVQLTIHGGLVTLDAKDATLREIFAEWARVGQARVVGGESVAGGPVTLLMTDVPERRALDTLLRSVAGFVAVPRPVQQPSLSTFDRIVVMPGLRPAAVPTVGPATSPNAAFQYMSPAQAARDRMASPQIITSDDEDQPDQGPTMPVSIGPAGQRPGMILGSPYSPVGGQVGSPPSQQPVLPSASQRPGVPTGPVQPIKGPGGL